MKKHEIIKDFILNLIHEESYNNILKLPSEMWLMQKFKVSRQTVRHALTQLKEENYITSSHGKGYFINKTFLDSQNDDSVQNRIALILQGRDSDATNEFIEGVKFVCAGRFDVDVFLTGNKISNERECLKKLIKKNYKAFIVDGVKTSYDNPNIEYYLDLYAKNVPILFYNNFYKKLKFIPKVILNDVKCSEELILRLKNKGHKNIGGIFLFGNSQAMEKYNGFINAKIKYGLSIDDELTLMKNFEESKSESFQKDIVKFLKTFPEITAIVCVNSIVLNAALGAIEKMNKQVPTDYSVVAFDYPQHDYLQKGITTTITPGKDMGIEVGMRILKMIEKGDYKVNDYSFVLPVRIHEGTSIKELTKTKN